MKQSLENIVPEKERLSQELNDFIHRFPQSKHLLNNLNRRKIEIKPTFLKMLQRAYEELESKTCHWKKKTEIYTIFISNYLFFF